MADEPTEPDGWPWPVPANVFPDPDRLDTIASINKAINRLAKFMAEQIATTPKPRYVLDGQEFDWPSLMEKIESTITGLVKLRQMIGGQVKIGWLGKRRPHSNFGV